jgi:hypothetical protein
MTRQNKALAIAAAVVAALWLALFFSSKGFLVWGDKPDADRKVGMLKCHYFTGTGFIEKQFLYSDQGFLGRQACPRTVDLK